MRRPVSPSSVEIKSGAPPKLKAAFNLFCRAGTVLVASVLLMCAGIVTSESRGSEIITALSRALLI